MTTQEPIGFVCTCGHHSVSELARWTNWYATTGEVFHETCEGCGKVFSCTLTAKPYKAP